jgi:hypothetical protein
MKKPFRYNETDSTRLCRDCNQPLKKNLLARNPEAERCYPCNKLHVNAGNINQKRLKAKQEQKKNGGQPV